MSSQVVGLPNRSESSHQKLYEFAKMALIKIFAHPYATVCDLYCCGGGGLGIDNDAQIGHYIGIDVSSTGIAQLREAWESLSQKKPYPSDFFHFDPCLENMETHLKEKTNQADIVCCLQHLQLCFETEERARKLLQNVSCLLKPGGYFFGITPDSSTIWAKYQKNVEAYHNKGSSMKPNIVPNCIRSESYMITFEVEEEKFPLFGKKYQLKFASDPSAETHCLVHFPSFIRLAREAGLEYVEIQNLTEFYDDNSEADYSFSIFGVAERAQFAGMITNSVPNLVDPRGRLLPRSYDVLGLYTTFIFQKPDPDIAPPIMTPILQETSYTHDERDWPAPGWRDDEKDGHTEPPLVLPKINDQKGILGPGPADLRFPEAL